jgi:cytochrome P450
VGALVRYAKHRAACDCRDGRGIQSLFTRAALAGRATSAAKLTAATRSATFRAAMVRYDPFDPEIIHGDPHPIYRQLRDEAPAYYVERFDCWALSRFEDVWRAGDDPNVSSARGSASGHLLTRVQPLLRMLNTMDPPDHTRLRALLRPLFSPGRMRRLEPAFRSFVCERLDALRDREVIDVVGEFAQPLATFVACTVAGFPSADGALLRELVHRFFAREAGVDGMTADGVRAQEDMVRYFARLITERRHVPQVADDALGVLLRYEHGGCPIPDEEVASNLVLILLGATDTLPKVFANTLQRLEQHPAQRARVVAEPGLALDAFHEALRIDMPTQYMCRSLLNDAELHGEKLRAGQPLLLLYASANRDEREFADPDAYRLDRRPPRHLGFSHGTHACLGLHAARAEGRIALAEFLARFPDYEVEADGAERFATEFVQGYAKLPIRLRPRTASRVKVCA